MVARVKVNGLTVFTSESVIAGKAVYDRECRKQQQRFAEHPARGHSVALWVSGEHETKHYKVHEYVPARGR